MNPIANTYEEFLNLKEYASTTKKVYLRLQKHIKRNPTQDDVNRFLIERPYKVARAFMKSYIIDYLQNHEIHFARISGRRRQILQSERVLSDREYGKLMTALPFREELICRLMKEAAMRQSEVLSLTEANFDFSKNKIVWFGKGNKECSGIIKTKTKEKLLKFMGQRKLREDEAVFGIKRSRLWQILSKVSMEVIGKRVSSHWMKRTCGRWLEDQNLTLEERQAYLKHASPITTQQHYSYKKGKDVMKKIKIIFK